MHTMTRTCKTDAPIILSESEALRIIANSEVLYKRGRLTRREFDTLKSEVLVRTVPTMAVLGMASQHADHLDTVVYAEPSDAECEHIYGIVRTPEGGVTHTKPLVVSALRDA